MSQSDAERLKRVGLCAACLHARVVRTPRGSEFWLCEQSKRDARFAKYPALPLLACAGFERALAGTR